MIAVLLGVVPVVSLRQGVVGTPMVVLALLVLLLLTLLRETMGAVILRRDVDVI